MGDSISDGTLIEILKSAGDSVTENEILGRIETDKVAIDLRAESNGVIKAVMAKVGENVKVGHVIMEMETTGKAAADAGASKPAAPAAAAPSTPAPAAAAPAAPAAASSSASHTPSYFPKIRFTHGKGRDNNGDFPSFPVHARAASHGPVAAPAAKAAPPKATPYNLGKQPTLDASAYWAKDPAEFRAANAKAAEALRALPAYYRRRALPAPLMAAVDLGGAADYEVKSKRAAAKSE